MEKMKRVHSKPEINSGEILVQTAGYISKERRIKSLMWAGRRIEELRSLGAFDVLPGETKNINQIKLDPTRSKGYDLSDAHKDLKDTIGRVKERSDRFKVQELEKKNKNEADKAVEKATEEEHKE